MQKTASEQISPTLAVQIDFRKLANDKKAVILRRFFKTGPGQYGEGDVFLGITVPVIRNFAQNHYGLPFADIEKVLRSPFHEERMLASIILIEKYKTASDSEQKKIFNLYLSNLKYLNNWDLIDLSAPKIIGAYLEKKPKDILLALAVSANMWERRIAIVSTFHYIKANSFDMTFKITDLLLKDKEDLIHKATGWMLREIGKRDQNAEEIFLSTRYGKMPRTMLRYAIERFPEERRVSYLKGTI